MYPSMNVQYKISSIKMVILSIKYPQITNFMKNIEIISDKALIFWKLSSEAGILTEINLMTEFSQNMVIFIGKFA